MEVRPADVGVDAVLHTHPQAPLGTELTELGKLGTDRFFQVDQVKPSKTELSKLSTTQYHSVPLSTAQFYSVPLGTTWFY